MSYPPPRPTSTSVPHDGTAPSSESQPTPTSQQGHSPLDWTNFMSFPTPPVMNAGPAGNMMRPPPTPPAHGKNDTSDQYGVARGMQMTQGHYPHHGGYGQPQGYYTQQLPQPSSSHPGYPSHISPSPLQTQMPLPPAPSPGSGPSTELFRAPTQSRPRPPSGGSKSAGKGKSPAHPPALYRSSSGLIQAQPESGDGLTLDPAAFSRDIRFQVPSFLSTQMGGAPTFPPGGEAWSGFSSSNVVGPEGTGLTPGQMFSNIFSLPPENSYHAEATSTYVTDGIGGQAWNGWKESDFGNPNYGLDPNASTSNRLTQTGDMTGHGGYPPPRTAGTGPSPRSSFQINTSHTIPSPSLGAAPKLLSPGQTSALGSSAPMPVLPPAISTTGGQDASSSQNASFSHPQETVNNGVGMGAMQPSALVSNVLQSHNNNGGFPYVPSISQSTSSSKPLSNINIASSSTAPYAPPSNTSQLLSAPVAQPFMGPSLSEGPGLYSTTGFDMVGVLARVASRKDPKTVLGPVDFSCSFSVVDIRRYDSPIVYASPTFCALTGYELPQILGRNCRFLQSPDGEVVKGSKRKYTDNIAVAHLKRMLNAGKECQASLINYRRGGIPFINLVTVVPIPWDGTDIVYHVGFQVDLVEQPNAILRNMRDGSYQVNYTVANPPQPPLKPAGRELGSSGLSVEIVEVLGQRVNSVVFGQGEDGPKMDWLKMVLEHSDDFVHVLSLKGLFQYVSPSVRRVLEYDPEDLLNKNIADICHPSDIVPLMRELKDSTHAPGEGQLARLVRLVFRIRRKVSGYVWIECAGRLHVEPGKGRKAVVLSGRARSVPSLPWEMIAKHGGLAEKEFWCKITFEGIILHCTSTVAEVLGQPSDDILGQSIFGLLPGGDNGPPHPSLLEQDRTSPVATVAHGLKSIITSDRKDTAISLCHKMVARSGEQVDVVTVLYSPKNRPELPSRSDSEGNSSASPSSDSSQPISADSMGLAGVKPTCIVVQIKLFDTTSSVAASGVPSSTSDPNTTLVASLTNARPVAHAGSSNLFEELETTRGTSWQYELHQLRLLNRRLKDDVLAARAVAKSNAKSGKGRKRKMADGVSGISVIPGMVGMVGTGGAGEMGPPPTLTTSQLPEQFSKAPRHQMAPGFGLLPPGMPNPYF